VAESSVGTRLPSTPTNTLASKSTFS